MTSIKDGNKRLARDVAWVEALKFNGNKFDMGEWGEKSECGTRACLGGWLTQSPGGRRATLAKWMPYRDDDGADVVTLSIDSDAISRHYVLNSEEYEFLFTQWTGPDTGKAALSEALARVRTLILWRELTGRHFDCFELGL